MNKFLLVNAVRIRADQLAAGAPPRVHGVDFDKPVSVALREIEIEHRNRQERAALAEKAEAPPVEA